MKGKGLNDFKFGTFIGYFPSDGAASIAVKGLMALLSTHKQTPCTSPDVFWLAYAGILEGFHKLLNSDMCHWRELPQV